MAKLSERDAVFPLRCRGRGVKTVGTVELDATRMMINAKEMAYTGPKR
jgi:hypothetical protein